MTQVSVTPSEAEPAAPMAQILWLRRDQRPVAAAAPRPSSRVSPAGWYADRLRFWDGLDWTDTVRPVSRPAPTGSTDGGACPPTVVGLLGLPPPAWEGSGGSATAPPRDPDGGALVVGLLGWPPPVGPAAMRSRFRARWRR